MTTIRFRFDPDKLVAALTLFASSGVPELDVMKCLKLLYFADKAHLLKYGRPILGDTYYGMAHGPVPSLSYTIIKAVLGGEQPPIQLNVSEYLDVDMSGTHPAFTAKRAPDMDAFSSSDLEVLQETVKKYGDKDGIELRRLAHQEPEIKLADEELKSRRRLRVDLPYQMFFASTDRRMLDLIEEDQEN